ncbi:hypothetical protein DFH09DRAFT_1285604 [Mycena vulgaris]|nr:hypothetical protein DFH09DRAFT_1285604 [Mycena vulgaris]
MTFSNYISAEAARVTVLSLEKLKKCYNLTISYDGSTTKGHQSIYTVHVTTAEHEVHLINGDEASGFSHTGHHIKKVLMESITKMCTTITHFSHSPNSTTHLKALRVCCNINHGLEKVGKTRFGTIYWLGYALVGCLPPICELIVSGVINTDDDKVGNLLDKPGLGWFKQIRVYQEFELELKQLVMILEPLARTIKCLEGLEVTVSDVWRFYVTVTAVLRDLFAEDILSFPNHSWTMFTPFGGLYLAGFYLDPEYVKSPLLFRVTANQLNAAINLVPTSQTSASNVTDQDLRDSMPSYPRVGIFLLTILAKELQAGRKDPAFIHYNSGDHILAAFKIQFEAYTRQYRHSVHAPSVDQAGQDTSTIVDMTKIYQHIRCESASEVGLEALNTIDPPDASSSSFTAVGATSIDSHNDGVDITLPFFRDLLADKPIPGANMIQSLADWSEKTSGSDHKGKKAAGNTTWQGEVAMLEF